MERDKRTSLAHLGERREQKIAAFREKMIFTAGSSLWCFAIEPKSGCGRSKPRDITIIPAQLWWRCSDLDSDSGSTRTAIQAEVRVFGFMRKSNMLAA